MTRAVRVPGLYFVAHHLAKCGTIKCVAAVAWLIVFKMRRGVHNAATSHATSSPPQREVTPHLRRRARWSPLGARAYAG
jgi:hypothetical protein